MAKKLICKRGHLRIPENLSKCGACKLCGKLRDRKGDLKHKKYLEEYRKAHREELRIRERIRYQEKREEILAKAKEKYARDPEPAKRQAAKWARENAERKRATDKAWVKAHPENHAATIHKRRARKALAGGSFTAEEWHELKRKYNFRCLCCNRRVRLEPDHVIPVSHGGTSFISNIQPLCRNCNAKKHTDHTDYRKG